jgi:hypothetical protein
MLSNNITLEEEEAVQQEYEALRMEMVLNLSVIGSYSETDSMNRRINPFTSLQYRQRSYLQNKVYT